MDKIADYNVVDILEKYTLNANYQDVSGKIHPRFLNSYDNNLYVINKRTNSIDKESLKYFTKHPNNLVLIKRSATYEPNATIYIGNLSRSVEEKDIVELFSKYGKVSKVTIKRSGGMTDYGFVEMPVNADGVKAAKALDGKRYHGNEMIANIKGSNRYNSSYQSWAYDLEAHIMCPIVHIFLLSGVWAQTGRYVSPSRDMIKSATEFNSFCP